jgi:O-antigen ligase
MHGLVAGVFMVGPILLYIAVSGRFPIRRSVIVFFVVAFLFLFTGVIHPEYWEWFNQPTFGVGFFIFLPYRGALWMFVMVEACGSFERVWRNLRVSVAVIVPYYALLAYRASLAGGWWGLSSSGTMILRDYDLDLGYAAAVVVLIACVAWVRKTRRLLWAIVGVVAFVGMLSFGSRGALLCLAAATSLALLRILVRVVRRNWVKLSLFVVLLSGALYLFVVSLSRLAEMLDSWLLSFGVSSRTLQQALTGDLLNDNGRGTIYALVINAIKERPMLGYGVFGDRPIVSDLFVWGYSHNLFLELAVSFGVILAGIVVVALACACARYFAQAHSSLQTQLLVVCLAMCSKLLVSDTFWGNQFFWMTLALLLVQRSWSTNGALDSVH